MACGPARGGSEERRPAIVVLGCATPRPVRARMSSTPASRPVPGATLDPQGLLAATIAFAIWGVFPLYLKPLAEVPALEVMAHRVAWCCVFVLSWLGVRGELATVRAALVDADTRRRLLLSTSLISVNWFTYVWAVANGHVIESSLGYFINPLLNVLLGVVFLKERLNRAQWVAVGFAVAGVVYLTAQTGRLPWIALLLACSFGFYGFTRKLARVEAVAGLGAETTLVAPFLAAWLIWLAANGDGAMGHTSRTIDLLLIGSGIITALPLALFAFGARRIPYSTVGVIQYLGPTLQLLCGIFVFGEPFPLERATGFVLIWVGLAVYLADGLHHARRMRPLAAQR